ncbi:hypothetical protein DIPPA_27194 [Diplonema papillatum]|nr:hypothetical protein DIPPA_27194 [Diplonema papillatum]
MARPWEDDAARLQRIDGMVGEMLRSIDGGWFQDWVETYLSENLHFVIAKRLNDPSHDKVGFGRTALVEWYNKSLVLVFNALGNSLGLEIKQEINLLSAESFSVDWTMNLEREQNSIIGRRRRFTAAERDGKPYFLRISSVPPFEEGDRDLEILQVCVPEPTVDIPVPACPHNSWDSVRCKNSHSILRCRRCNACWKLHASQSHQFRCLEFLSDSCPHADEVCRRIHVYPRKRRLHERKPGSVGPHHPAPAALNPPILVPRGLHVPELPP